MRSDLKSRLPLLELSIFLVMAILGLAAFWIHNEENMVQAQSDHLKELREESDRVLLESNAMQQVFNELQEAFKGELSQQQSNKMETVLRLPEALQIKEEYLAIADHLQTSVDDLGDALTNLVNRTRNAEEIFQHTRQETEDWLKKEKYHVEAGRFVARSQNLKDTIAREESSSTNRQALITKDLGALLDEFQRTYTSWLTNALYVVDNLGKPITGDKKVIDGREEKAGNEGRRLGELASEARAEAEAVEWFLESQWGSESNKRDLRQREAAKLLQETHSALEFAGRKGLQPGTARPIAPGVSDSLPQLRHVLLALLIAQVGLGIFLAAAIYRRLVSEKLEKLHLRLLESTTRNKLAHFQNLLERQAHEIKQPLMAISGRLYALQKTLAPGSDEHKDATVISGEIDRLDRIVKDFLQLARPSEPKPSYLTAEAALDEVRDLMRFQPAHKAIEFKCEVERDVEFRADPPQLKQVLINLVKNAAESIEGRGVITLRARKGAGQLNGKSTEVVILEVEDTGAGIAPENQEKVFDPFFSTKDEGSGLGLANAKRIIDRHGGRLEFETRVGQGTIFRIVLPACAQEKAA